MGAVQESEGGDPDGFESSEDFFPDDEGEVEHEDNINGIASVGIVQGKMDGDYDPNQPVSRGQMAAFIMRFYEVNVDQGRVASKFPGDGDGSTTPPGEAAAGEIALDDADGDTSDALVNVDSADKADDSFIGCDIETDGVTGTETTDQDDCAQFDYDSNDTFTVDGAAATLAEFEAALSENDDVAGTYDADPTGTSTFNLTNESGPSAAVQSTDAYIMLDALTAGTADTGDVFRIVFDEPMEAVEDGDTIAVTDADGDIATVTCENTTDGTVSGGDAECELNSADVTIDGTTFAAGQVLTVELLAAPTDTNAGTGDGVFQYPLTITDQTGFTSTDGDTWTPTDDPDNVIDDEGAKTETGVFVASDADAPTATDATFVDDPAVADAIFGDELADEVTITYDENVVVSDGDTVALDSDGDPATTTTYTCGTEVTCVTVTTGTAGLTDDLLTVTVLDAAAAPDTTITDGTSTVDGTTGVTDTAGNEADGYPEIFDTP